MKFMETSLMVYDYPEPTEKEERAVSVKVYVSYTIDFTVPSDWDNQDVEQYIKSELNNLPLCDEEIEHIEFD